MAPRVNIVIGADTKGFAKGISGVKSALNKLVPGGLVQLLGVGAIASFSKAALVAADDVATFAARTGLSLRAVQELKFAADETDTSLQAFAASFRTLAQAQADAMAGRGKEQIDSFRQLGISMDEIKNLSPEQLFFRVADAIKRSGREGQNLNAALTVLGRSAMEVLPAMQQGLDNLAASAHKFGMVMADDVVGKLADANDNIDRFVRQARIGFGKGIGWVMDMAEQGLAIAAARYGGSSWSQALQFSRDTFERNAKARAAARAARNPLTAPTLTPPIDPTQPAKHQAVSFMLPTADALARIGLFRGGYDSAQRTREDQLRELKDMKRQLEALNREMTT